MSHLKKIIKIIVNIFTGFLLLLLALVLYGKAVLTFGNNIFPNYFGYTFFEVASGSMEPTLKINDVIIVKITKDNLNKGDIIAFYNGKTVITHRIVFVEGNIITVKGDNNNVVDKPITKEQVIGKIVKIFPELGIWKKVLTEPKILFGIFITLLLFDFALSYDGKDKKNEVKKEKNKKNKKEKETVKEEKTSENDEIELAKQILPEKEEIKLEKKKIESQKLLDFTRKIDIEEINKLLEGTEYKLEKKEIDNIKKEVNRIKESDVKEEEPMFSEHEKKTLEYTMRLDLSEIQKRIKSKVK